MQLLINCWQYASVWHVECAMFVMFLDWKCDFRLWVIAFCINVCILRCF